MPAFRQFNTNTSQEKIMPNHFIMTQAVSVAICFCFLSSLLQGQEQAIPPAAPLGAPMVVTASTCENARCNYYYDERQNVYIITQACGEQTCYCPIDITAGSGEQGKNGDQGNQGEANATAAYACANPGELAENRIRVSLRHGAEYVNLTLNFKDPAKLPNKSVRFQYKSNAADPGFKWEVNVTYDPGKFEQHKPSPLGTPTGAKIAESNLYYLGGAFETFGHYDDATAKTRGFEFNQNYKVEITRGN
jgi:hypothetical protein